MSMNIDARPPVVYPTFHDTQHPSNETSNKKEVDIDNSVYHLLSLYLNTDAILDTSMLPLPNSQHNSSLHSPYWKSKTISNRSIRTQRNWFGEEKNKNHMKKNRHELVLERNTLKNSIIKAHDYDYNNELTTTTKRSRTKSVSFNETVTVILSQDIVSQSKLKQQQQQPNNDHHHSHIETNLIIDDDDDSIFVDALECFE